MDKAEVEMLSSSQAHLETPTQSRTSEDSGEWVVSEEWVDSVVSRAWVSKTQIKRLLSIFHDK